jgi:transcriptional regulator of acetoin/glycerol metabolism
VVALGSHPSSDNLEIIHSLKRKGFKIISYEEGAQSWSQGVLFLDAIGEFNDAFQAKLLRVLQERRVLGVGEDQEVLVDVRVITATPRDLI